MIARKHLGRDSPGTRSIIRPRSPVKHSVCRVLTRSGCREMVLREIIRFVFDVREQLTGCPYKLNDRYVVRLAVQFNERIISKTVHGTEISPHRLTIPNVAVALSAVCLQIDLAGRHCSN